MAIRLVGSTNLTVKVTTIDFYDITYANLFPTPLSVIGQDVPGMGDLAAQRLVDRINGNITGKLELIELLSHLIAKFNKIFQSLSRFAGIYQLASQLDTSFD